MLSKCNFVNLKLKSHEEYLIYRMLIVNKQFKAFSFNFA